jgi:hypothetical protein
MRFEGASLLPIHLRRQFIARRTDRLSRHPNALVLPTLPANASVYVCGIGSVLEFFTASCR